MYVWQVYGGSVLSQGHTVLGVRPTCRLVRNDQGAVEGSHLVREIAVCMYVCMYVCIYVNIFYLCTYIHTYSTHILQSSSTVLVKVFFFLYIYVHTYIHTHDDNCTYIHSSDTLALQARAGRRVWWQVIAVHTYIHTYIHFTSIKLSMIINYE